MEEKLTEIQKIKIVAVDYRYWTPKVLIESALKAGVFMNLNKNRCYSYERVYAMLREGKGWVTKKLIEYARKNSLTHPKSPSPSGLVRTWKS